MLRETWRSETIWQINVDAGGVPVKGLVPFLTGLCVRDDHLLDDPEKPPPIGPTGVYIFGVSQYLDPRPHNAYWYLDGYTGKFIRRTDAGGLGIIMSGAANGVVSSRAGAFWGQGIGSIFGNDLNKFSVNSTGVDVTETVTMERFGPVDPGGTHLTTWGSWMIDDVRKPPLVLMTGGGAALYVFEWESGKFKYSQPLPCPVTAICHEGEDRCYIWLTNQVLMLFDYVRGEVLGVAKVPSPSLAQPGSAGGRMAWDVNFHRLLFVERFDYQGAHALVVRGFSLINEPLRITKPIPLKVPRQGRTIPVLVQVVDEVNKGVGGYQVEATVTGYGSLVGVPLTDFRGDALIQVACVGSPFYSPESPGFGSPGFGGGGSPPGGPGGPGSPGGPGDPTDPDSPLYVPPIGRPAWVGWFEFESQASLAYIPPGNCYMWVDEGGIITKVDHTQFATWISAIDPADPHIEDINDGVAACVGPAVAYWNARTWPEWPVLRTGDWIALQAFCRANESPASFEINIQALINSVPAGNNICLVAQCYTSNALQTSNLISLVPVYARLLAANPRVTMLLAFSDQGRESGMNDHPEVKPYWQALYDGVSTPTALMAAAPVQSIAIPSLRTVPNFTHQIWVGCFFATGMYGNVDHNGNCEVLIATSYANMVRARPVFADMASAPSVPTGQLLGIYVVATDGNYTDLAVRNAIAYAEAHGVPTLIYVDMDTYPQGILDAYLNDATGTPIANRIPVVRGYPAAKNYGDPLVNMPDDEITRIRAVVASLAGVYERVAMNHTYYTQWQTGLGTENYPESHILGMQSGLAAIESDYQMFASLGFARLRPSGMDDYPSLLAAYTDECLAAVLGGPEEILLPVPSVSTEVTPVGDVLVVAKVYVSRPPTPLSALPGSGAAGLPGGGGGGGGGGTPGPPGGGSDPGTGLPETAPNMKYIVDQVYASKTWDLTTDAGRGAFTEAAVIAIHDVNALFGFARPEPGQPAYRGHTVDSVIYKDADGTGELFNIVGRPFDWAHARIVTAPDVSKWPETAKITELKFDGSNCFMNHTKMDGAGRWPDVLAGTGPDTYQWTWWLFLWMGAEWVGSAFQVMWYGRTDCGSINYFDHWYSNSSWNPMPSHGPVQDGENIAFMATSGNARNSTGPYGPQERSDVIVFPSIKSGLVNLTAGGATTSWTFAGRDAAIYARWHYPSQP